MTENERTDTLGAIEEENANGTEIEVHRAEMLGVMKMRDPTGEIGTVLMIVAVVAGAETVEMMVVLHDKRLAEAHHL